MSRPPFLHRAPLPLPAALDRVAERWARLPPRVRLVMLCLLLAVLGLQCANRQTALFDRWGGDGQLVWRATELVPAGQSPDGALERIRLPAAAVPPDPAEDVPRGATLSVALVEGGVLTDTHLAPVGPAVGLAADQRLLPVPLDGAWGVESGAVVDVWAVDRGPPGAPRLLAAGRRVVAVHDDGTRPVALLALQEGEVGAATEALGTGRLLLTLAPGPDG